MKKLFLMFFLTLIYFVPISYAGDADNADYAYGEVVAVSDGQLTLLEYDYELDEELKVDYLVTPQTAATNIAKVALLAKGDTVEVYYKESDGKRAAQMIIKDDMPNSTDDQILAIEPKDQLTDEIR